MINAKPYICRHCKNPLGLTSNKTLSIGLVKINQAVKLHCGHCGRSMTWRPVTVIAKEMVPVAAYPV